MKTVLCGALISVAATLAAAQNSTPPPLTAEQVAQVRALVQRTQTEQAQLKTALAEAQEKLAECYSSFELDDDRINGLQAEIIDLQRKLLASHHTMQKELRPIVGPERFRILIRRIENALKDPPRPEKK
jgi:peptidoglycan hydrolase CwlO-like protein